MPQDKTIQKKKDFCYVDISKSSRAKLCKVLTMNIREMN